MILFITLTLTGLEGMDRPFLYYYGVLYNRVYFMSLYLTVFLLGVIPIAAPIFVGELVIRFKSKLKLSLSLFKQLMYYSIFYGISFLTANIIILLFFSVDSLSRQWPFLLICFLFQIIIWIFVGSVFLIIYILIRNVVLTYLLDILIMAIFIYLANSGLLHYLKYYISGAEAMYFVPTDFALDKTILFIMYYSFLVILLFLVIIFILKRQDLLFRQKGD